MKTAILALCASSASAFVNIPKLQSLKTVVRAEDDEAEAAPSPAPAPAPVASSGGFGLAQLQALAAEQNPIVGYFDPLGLSEDMFFEETNEATIGFLRQAELKHGRVAMAGFVGFLVHAQGITWPFPMNLAGDKWPTLGEGGVPALWDQLPQGAKWQIILAIGCAEWYDEWQYDVPSADMGLASDKPKHYMRGGEPGRYPKFEGYPLNLFDPFGFFKKNSEEKKAKGRNAEVNNGRLAMIGLFGLLAESKVPGSVPFLTQFNFPQYSGNVMVPFEGQFSLF
jgi:hypothetical protein